MTDADDDDAAAEDDAVEEPVPEVGETVGENPPADFDNPWKEVLDEAFEPFAELFFPAAHAGRTVRAGAEDALRDKRRTVGKRGGPRRGPN